MSATNISDLSSVFSQYQSLSGKSSPEVLEKQGSKLFRQIYYGLRDIKPRKGQIAAELQARLAIDKGIKIRPSVLAWVRQKRASDDEDVANTAMEEAGVDTGRRSYWADLVHTELGVRERGRGVLAASTLFGSEFALKRGAESRFGDGLSYLDLNLNEDGGSMKLEWREDSDLAKRVVRGIRAPRAKQAIENAIKATKEDILVYVRRKQSEVLKKVVKALTK